MRFKEEADKIAENIVQEDQEQIWAQDKQKKDFQIKQEALVEHLVFVLDEYQAQYNGIDGRLGNRRTAMLMSILFFGIVCLVDAFFTFLLWQPGASVLGRTWEMWVACIAIMVAQCKTGLTVLKKVFDYEIHNEIGFSSQYRAMNGIYTLKDEKRFCAQKIKEIKTMIQDLETMNVEEMAAAGNVSDMRTFFEQYEDIQYIDKRADKQVFSFFDDHEMLCYIVIAAFYLIRTLF